MTQFRYALGIPYFNYSQNSLNFTAAWQGFLAYGFEQSMDMDIYENTRSGQINLFGLESDILYPFDWFRASFSVISSKLKIIFCRYKIQFLVAAVSPDTNQTVPMAGASIFNPEQAHWKATTEYLYLDNLNGQAAKLAVSITMRRHLIVKISAFVVLILNCEWIALTSGSMLMRLRASQGL
jgi:hypothetical protein